jgi:hypothetical protein
VLGTQIIIVNDYETNNKIIGDIYSRFKKEYKIPFNYFEIIKNDKYLSFYYSEEERKEYLNLWEHKMFEPVISYTESEYAFYVNLNLENQVYNDLQSEHYIDNGCLCKGCSLNRSIIFENAKKGLVIKEKITHTEIVNKIIKYNIKNKLKRQTNTKPSQKINNNLMTSLIRS